MQLFTNIECSAFIDFVKPAKGYLESVNTLTRRAEFTSCQTLDPQPPKTPGSMRQRGDTNATLG